LLVLWLTLLAGIEAKLVLEEMGIKNSYELENVAIANVLQLEAARATPVLSRFNDDAMLSLTSLNLSIAVLRFCC